MSVSRRAALLAGLATLALAPLGGTVEPSAAGSGASATAEPLVRFRSCGSYLDYVKTQAERNVGPSGLGAAQPTPTATTRDAPKQGVDNSGTNVQEAGVDEPDLVKTNGETLFAVTGGSIHAVDVEDKQPRLLDTLKLPEGWSHELLLHGDRLLVLARGGFWAEPLPAVAARFAPFVPSTSVVQEIDVSNPKALRVTRTLTIDGSYVAARLVGRSVRLVV